MCFIDVDNIGLYPKSMEKCIEIIKHFTQGDRYFFGFYRVDGFNMTAEELKKAAEQIPAFFNANGTYLPLQETIVKRGKPKVYSGYLTAASAPATEETYKLLASVFHYYLETTFFCPKVEWETFTDSYCNYMHHGCNDYVKNEFTNFLFTYSDSGDFSVQFNPDLYDTNQVMQDVINILNS